jgi:ubiquinone/menaquinone biosynthesis C-methylase UbiE
MLNDDIVNIYSKIAEKYANAFFNELENKPLDKKLYELFASKVIKNGKCIEIGCGPGEISTYLNTIGITNIIGIDKSKEMIEQAKKHNQNVQYIQGDAFELSFDNNCIDGIVAPYLIVNFSDKEIEKSFQEMNRVMKLNSPILIVFHVGTNRKIKIRSFFGEGNNMIFILHNLGKIKKIMKRTLFSIEEVIVKEPYEGEITKRAYVFARKIK